MSRGEDTAAILVALSTMSDGDVGIVSRLLSFGAPSALATSGAAPQYDHKREYGTAVLDPRPDPRGVTAGAILAAYRMVAEMSGRRLP